MAAGYDEKLNVHYDEKYVFGNSVSLMVASKLTEEQYERTIKNLEDFHANYYNATCKITHRTRK